MRLSEIEEHLRKYRVGIAGAGGLGSNCAVTLARCGVGSLVIVDHDLVEESNLSRQSFFKDQIGRPKTVALKENILRIRPDIIIDAINKKLDALNIPEIFAGCDIIVEAFDRADMKQVIIESVCEKMPGTPLIVGSGLAGWGHNESLQCRKVDDFLYVCGDEYSEVSENCPPLAPRVGIVANMQANVVIEILMTKIQTLDCYENYT
jgi:sulfur carrier protein ThiS adenylyltransferase